MPHVILKVIGQRNVNGELRQGVRIKRRARKRGLEAL